MSGCFVLKHGVYIFMYTSWMVMYWGNWVDSDCVLVQWLCACTMCEQWLWWYGELLCTVMCNCIYCRPMWHVFFDAAVIMKVEMWALMRHILSAVHWPTRTCHFLLACVALQALFMDLLTRSYYLQQSFAHAACVIVFMSIFEWHCKVCSIMNTDVHCKSTSGSESIDNWLTSIGSSLCNTHVYGVSLLLQSAATNYIWPLLCLQEVLIFLNNFKKKIGDNYTDDDVREFVKNTLSAGQVCDDCPRQCGWHCSASTVHCSSSVRQYTHNYMLEFSRCTHRTSKIGIIGAC